MTDDFYQAENKKEKIIRRQNVEHIYFFILIYNKFLFTIYSFVKKQYEGESFDCKQCFILKDGRKRM